MPAWTSSFCVFSQCDVHNPNMQENFFEKFPETPRGANDERSTENEDREILPPGEDLLVATRRIETFLEHEQAKKDARELVRKNPLLRKMLGKRVYGILAAGLFLLNVSVSVLKAETQEHVEQETPRYERIEKDAGLDLRTLTKNFHIEIQLDDEEGQGNYILHIGQTHSHPMEGLFGLMVREKAVATQRKIEELLLSLKVKGINAFFIEGHAEGDGLEWSKRFLIKTKRALSNIELNLKGLDQLALLYLERSKLSQEWPSLREYLVYLFMQKINEIEEHRRTNPSLYEGGGARVYDVLKELLETSFEGEGPDTPYYRGAARKLYYEGLIDVLPAETEEANARAKKAMEKREEMKNLHAERFVALTPAERKGDSEFARIKRELEQAEADFNLANEAREDIALAKIEEYASQVGNRKFVPLIYGEVHDFSNNLEIFNGKSDKKFGLIKLTPKINTQ